MGSVIHSIDIKTHHEIEIMEEGGKKMREIKKTINKMIKEGVSASEIEEVATKKIEELGGEPSFKMVPRYSWSTCVNVNEGLVHGIPHDSIVFKKGDVVSVDVGLYYKKFHTDTSITVAIEPTSSTVKFLEVGKKALNASIKKAKIGNRIYDISETIQNIIEDAGFTPVKALVGHGLGRELHEEPQIPCFVQGRKGTSPKIKEGMALAIEVMYTMGKSDVKLEPDGWTIGMRDGKISALFEETIAITTEGPLVLT